MAQQSARRDQENQGFPPCLEHASGDLDRIRELPYRPATVHRRTTGRTDGSIRLRVRTSQIHSCAEGGVHRWKADVNPHRWLYSVGLRSRTTLSQRRSVPPARRRTTTQASGGETRSATMRQILPAQVALEGRSRSWSDLTPFPAYGPNVASLRSYALPSDQRPLWVGSGLADSAE